MIELSGSILRCWKTQDSAQESQPKVCEVVSTDCHGSRRTVSFRDRNWFNGWYIIYIYSLVQLDRLLWMGIITAHDLRKPTRFLLCRISEICQGEKCWTPDSGHVPNELCILSWIYCDHFGVLDGVLVDCRYFRRMDSNQQLSDPNWPGDFRHQQRSDRRRRLVDRLTVWVWMPAQLPQKRKRLWKRLWKRLVNHLLSKWDGS